jgi:branched-subunit amino acid transport protein
MSDLVLVVAVAVITFGSRVAFLLRPRSVPGGFVGRFLDVFPLALFVAIATDALAAPGGSVTASPGLAAAVGGVIGGAVFRRALWGVLGVGAAVFYLVRGLWG